MANRTDYFLTKDNPEDGWGDITGLFDGVAILKLEGLYEKGEAINVYTAQWVNEQEEDLGFTKWDGNHNPIIVRKNVDIEMTFIIRQKYATGTIDVSAVHDEFVDYMTSSDLWLKSDYAGGKYVHCVCLNAYKPTIVKLGRGENSYIMGTLTFHCLDTPKQDNE